MNTYHDNPNFSIALPGGCNAECKFCFAKDKACNTAQLGEYITNLVKRLQQLPEPFFQISITGNEPTLSPYLVPVMASIMPFKSKYTNILMTSNGTGLLKHFDSITMAVDHINISRHHYEESKNLAIFGGQYNIVDNDIKNIIDKYSIAGIDISANCVINDNTDIDFIEKYILWARNIGFTAVRFRKENGNLEQTPVELLYKDYKIFFSGSCPVCRTAGMRIHGLPVYWKSSVIEPSTVMTDKIFELIYAPDGKTYKDWEYKKPYVLEKRTASEFRSYSKASSSSCGRSSC